MNYNKHITLEVDMSKLLKSIFLWYRKVNIFLYNCENRLKLSSKSIFLIFFIFCSTFVFAEDITITTYYPSPYGSYDYLFADKLGVGNNDGVAGFTAADVPTTSGHVWIASRLGIATGVGGPTTALDVIGTVKATAYQVGATAGISSVLSVRDAGGAVDCNITVTNGIITASTC